MTVKTSRANPCSTRSGSALMRSGSARATAESCVSSSRRVASSTAMAGGRSSGIAGERIWGEWTEDRKVDSLGQQDIHDDRPKLVNRLAPHKHRKERDTTRRFTRLVVDQKPSRRLANGVTRILAPDFPRDVRSSRAGETTQKRGARALERRRVRAAIDVREALGRVADTPRFLGSAERDDHAQLDASRN